MSEGKWILLRGLARESGHWGDFVTEFADRLGVQAFAIDLPGTGVARDVPSPTTLAGIVDFVRIQARAATEPPFHLLTVSLGAMVAFEWQRLYPEEITGAVVINASVANLSHFYHRLRWQIWGRFARALSLPTPRERERAVTELVINDPAARAEALVRWTKLAHERPISFQTFARQLWAASRGRLRGGGTARGLVLTGLGDRLVDPSCSMAIAERLRWPIKRHAWAGHDLTWDDGPWVIERVADWVNVANSEPL